MSGSAITDALITMLGAASAFGSQNVAKDYSVLERSSGCCCVVTWRRVVSAQVDFGDDRDRQWTHTIQGFVKDLGDPISTMSRINAFSDTVLAVLENDDTLQGTVERIDVIEGNRDLNAAVTSGGMTWFPIYIDVVSTEFV